MNSVSFNEKKSKKSIIFFVCLVLCFVASCTAWFFSDVASGHKERQVFLFESYSTSDLACEVRTLEQMSHKTAIRAFVDELLLGPISPDARPLFPLGTTVRSCFLRDGVLYLDLSEDAIQLEAGTPSQNTVATEILKRNLFTNFRNIDIIKLYIVGKEVYETYDL